MPGSGSFSIECRTMAIQIIPKTKEENVAAD